MGRAAPPLTDAEISGLQGIPKSAKAGGNGDVHIYNNSGVQVEAKSERRSGPRGDELHITLEKAMASAVARGGPLTTALETRYPLEQTPRMR